MQRLFRDFFCMPATELAPKLLGKIVVRKIDGEILRCRITETECYYGFEDSASHASRGRTERNSTMFCQGGIVYVYLCYGMHNMLNIVSGNEGHPEAVLVRGVEGASGPGRVTKLLSVNRQQNSKDLCHFDELFVEDDGFVPAKIFAAPRIGIDYADEADRQKLWRFFYKPN